MPSKPLYSVVYTAYITWYMHYFLFIQLISFHASVDHAGLEITAVAGTCCSYSLWHSGMGYIV